MRVKRGSFTKPQGRIPEPLAFNGKFPKVRIRLTYEDIYGRAAGGFGIVPREERNA